MIIVVVQICRVHICIYVIGYVVDSLFTIRVLIVANIVVIDVFDLFNLSMLDVKVLFLLCFTDPSLFSFLYQPMFAIVFHLTFFLLFRM